MMLERETVNETKLEQSDFLKKSSLAHAWCAVTVKSQTKML
jgi:hypothetical protein